MFNNNNLNNSLQQIITPENKIICAILDLARALSMSRTAKLKKRTHSWRLHAHVVALSTPDRASQWNPEKTSQILYQTALCFRCDPHSTHPTAMERWIRPTQNELNKPYLLSHLGSHNFQRATFFSEQLEVVCWPQRRGNRDFLSDSEFHYGCDDKRSFNCWNSFSQQYFNRLRPILGQKNETKNIMSVIVQQ